MFRSLRVCIVAAALAAGGLTMTVPTYADENPQQPPLLRPCPYPHFRLLFYHHKIQVFNHRLFLITIMVLSLGQHIF